MLNQSPVTRVTDIIPREMIGQPFDENAFHEAMARFVRYALPICVGVAGASAVTVLAIQFAEWWIATFFFVVALSLVTFLVFAWRSYCESRGDLKDRRKERQDVVLAVQKIVNHVTIQNVTVERGASYNTYANLNGQPLSEQPVLAINETYDLALKIIRIGIEAWIANGNRRPTPKPISADAITDKLRVGREKWTEAMQLIKEAGVFDKPDATYWRPLYKDYEESKKQLDNHLKKTYFLKTVGSKQVWMR